MRLISNAEIYGREYGAWPFAYRCSTCGAYIGLHPDTDLPLGIMADRATTKARKAAKGEFGPGRRALRRQAGEAYAWLARALGIAPSICHFGMFDQQRSAPATSAAWPRPAHDRRHDLDPLCVPAGRL